MSGTDTKDSAEPGTRASKSTTIQGQYVTLERIAPRDIPLLFAGLGLPKNNHLFDLIIGFPYVYDEDDLSNYIFGYLRDHPDLTIYAIKACPLHLGPPSPPDAHSHTAVLGFMGYRTHPQSRTITLDDAVSSPLLQRTYAATEANYLFLRHMFEEQETAYVRIGLSSSTLNVKSRKYTERLGYKYEGTCRKDKITRWGTSRDSDFLSMLDDEWPLNKRALETWLEAANFDAEGKQIRSLQEVRTLLQTVASGPKSML